MAQFFDRWVIEASEMFIGMVGVWIIMIAAEQIFPKGRTTIGTQIRGSLFWMVYAGIAACVVISVSLILQTIQPVPLFSLKVNDWFAHPDIRWMAYVVTPLLSISIWDFFQYWMHRAQHRFFWRQHSMHHSIEQVSCLNSYFHWTEVIFSSVFITIPAAFIVSLDGPGMAGVAAILIKVHGSYLHSATGFQLGPVLRRVIADNRFHRIHHSRETPHFDKNFGGHVTIWDQVFGTAYFPEADEWPDTGLPAECAPTTVADFLWRPFRARQFSPDAVSDIGASQISHHIPAPGTVSLS